MSASKKPAALFDFDGTITRRDTMVPFLLHLLKRYPRGLLDVPWLTALLGPYALGLVTKERMKTEALRIFARVPEADRPAVVQRFHDAELSPMYLPGALERIARHRRQGHMLVLVSASLDLYLAAAARHLGFDACICTRIEAGSHPRVVGANCWGREKVNRLMDQEWFDRIDWPESWAYSDHYSDLPMLMLCGYPVAATPKKTLRRHALREGWPIIDWR